jgi:uncharacterized protein
VPRRILSLDIPGPAGRLEALLEEPEHGAPREAALVCHPHPLYGGTMHNKVVFRLARGLRHSGSAVLRFNFRGVGRSQGEHAGGTGELEDARAALAWLRDRYPDLPFTLAGFSFGARVVSKLGCELADAQRVILLGFPTRGGDFDYLANCSAPTIFVQSTHDNFGPREQLDTLYAQLAGPKRILWIEAADHFFDGALDSLEHAVAEI